MKAKDTSKPRRRWLQFSLRGVLLLMLVVALGLGWITNERRKVWLEDRAVEKIEGLGGHVTRSLDSRYQEGRFLGMLPLRMLLFGRTVDFPVSSVKLPCCTDLNVMRHFRDTRALRAVELPGCLIGDDEILQLVMCKDLETLDLSATNITDAGVAQLGSLPHLSSVKLDHTAVTGNGLNAFAGHGLKHLSIRNTAIPEEAAAQFRAAHAELKWFYHNCARSEQEREAVKRLTQAGATFPGYQDWGIGLGPKGRTVVRLGDGVTDLLTRWHGRPQDLDLLVSIDSRLHVALEDSVCSKPYIERLAGLDTAEGVHLKCLPGQLHLLACLSGMDKLENLSVTIDCPSTTRFAPLAHDDFEFIPRLVNLSEFNLSFFLQNSNPPACLAADQAALLPLADCPKLRHVGLYNIGIPEETLAQVIQAPSLETIHLKPASHLSQETIDKYKNELEKRVEARKRAAK
jgi:hypothetical protein